MVNKMPHICFGMTLYNNAKYLPEAIESLLNQTYDNFFLIAVDDCSTDGTEDIMRRYAARDKRISYFRNTEWVGMIATWRIAFYKAWDLYKPDYFAWASDHDRWHPEWLSRHVHILNKHQEVVLAYPGAAPIDENGEIIQSEQSPQLETLGMQKIDRIYNVCRYLSGAGSKVYGLFRSETLMKAGVFRNLTLPDRLLIVELSLHGSFKYIPHTLWYRRGAIGTYEETIRNQNVKLFGPQSPLCGTFPYISHCISLILSEPLGEQHSTFFSRLLLSMIYWESNSEYIIKEISMLNDILKKRLKHDQLPLNAEMLESVSETIKSILGRTNKGHENSQETASALLFAIMLFTNYMSPAKDVREIIEQKQIEIHKLTHDQLPLNAEFLKSISEAIGSTLGCTKDGYESSWETAHALLLAVMLFMNYMSSARELRKIIEQKQIEAHKMKELAEKYKAKFGKERAESEYWKNKATSGTFNNIKHKARKIFKDR